jgi:hypothetical protein
LLPTTPPTKTHNAKQQTNQRTSNASFVPTVRRPSTTPTPFFLATLPLHARATERKKNQNARSFFLLRKRARAREARKARLSLLFLCPLSPHENKRAPPPPFPFMCVSFVRLRTRVCVNTSTCPPPSLVLLLRRRRRESVFVFWLCRGDEAAGCRRRRSLSPGPFCFVPFSPLNKIKPTHATDLRPLSAPLCDTSIHISRERREDSAGAS